MKIPQDDLQWLMDQNSFPRHRPTAIGIAGFPWKPLTPRCERCANALACRWNGRRSHTTDWWMKRMKGLFTNSFLMHVFSDLLYFEREKFGTWLGKRVRGFRIQVWGWTWCLPGTCFLQSQWLYTCLLIWWMTWCLICRVSVEFKNVKWWSMWMVNPKVIIHCI